MFHSKEITELKKLITQLADKIDRLNYKSELNQCRIYGLEKPPRFKVGDIVLSNRYCSLSSLHPPMKLVIMKVYTSDNMDYCTRTYSYDVIYSRCDLKENGIMHYEEFDLMFAEPDNSNKKDKKK